jgi:hypothetical protein
MQVGELQAHFPWGVLLITDAASTEQIPAWDSDEHQATSSRSAVVLRVLHGDEGPVTVRVWEGDGPEPGHRLFDSSIDIPSGVLQVGDALGDEVLRLDRQAGSVRIEVLANEPREADLVDVVISKN